jgi:hypothetical protein
MKKIFLIFVGFIMVFFYVSCVEEATISNLLGTSVSAPMYCGLKVISGKEVEFYFSTEIKVLSASLQPEIEVKKISKNNTVFITMNEDRSGGEKFIADILVEDSNGNTLNVLAPFRTRNNRIPELVLNEIRLDYTKPRGEFIELKSLTDGNLGAMRIFVASASVSEPVYEFPPVEVSKDEYIIVHMRILSTDNPIDELGNNLALSSAGNKNDAPEDVRDIWVPSSKKILHKTDVIYLMDQDDKIIDGILICEDEKSWKKNTSFVKSAELLAKQKKWLNKDGIAVPSPQAEDAVKSEKTTATRTLCRIEDKADGNTMSDWYICNSSKCTPGKPNSDDRYSRRVR